MLDHFVKLYKTKSTPAKRLNVNDVNLRVFREKRGLPVSLVRTSSCIDEIYPLKSYYAFFERHKTFWMVPIATPSLKIVGFILRGTSTKEYRTVFDYVDIPPMFGFEDFKDFKTNKPIILCEGVKDAIYLKTHYKHTLSLNTSSISVINLEILSKLTNYLILAYDNDSVGVASSLDDRDMLIKNGFTCEIITPTQKDCAEFIENKTGENDFIYSLRQKLKYLGGEYGIN